jgi:hypothetical protein
MKIVKYKRILTPEDCVDVTLFIENREVVRFALNYRAFIDGEWKEVYRVDNFHGFLHEQRFWISPEPVKLELFGSLNCVVEEYLDRIADYFEKYRKYMEEKCQSTKKG